MPEELLELEAQLAFATAQKNLAVIQHAKQVKQMLANIVRIEAAIVKAQEPVPEV